jgi:outer membrane protein assembly factor BamB
MPSPTPRRGVLAAISVFGAVAALGLSGCGGSHRHHPRRHAAPKPPPPAPKPKPKPAAVPTDRTWPFYGYGADRTRIFPHAKNLDPPFRRGWTFHGHALLEFPPVIFHNTLYFEDYYAHTKAVSVLTGHSIWTRAIGTLAAASPGLDVKRKLVFFVALSTHPGARLPGDGRVVALSMKTGKVVWSHDLGSGSESSPLVLGNSVIIGDAGGTVHSYRANDGHSNWTFQASGAVKGGIAFGAGKLFFGDYGGHVYALDPGSGHEIWSSSTGGTFYSTPAVAFGHVYLGNTNGNLYAFSAGSGARSWSGSTGSYVYASPAVANIPGLGPTVYEGSYDGNFRAYNAYTGSVRWIYDAGGAINGSATIIGNVVYYANLRLKNSIGLNARTGRKVFEFKDGEFTPVVADGRSVFLIGYSTIYQLRPGR